MHWVIFKGGESGWHGQSNHSRLGNWVSSTQYIESKFLSKDVLFSWYLIIKVSLLLK